MSVQTEKCPHALPKYDGKPIKEFKKFANVYLDDILIYSKTEEYHLMHVKEVSKVLSCNGLFLNTFKSDSDYEEILDSESEVEEELQYESVDDYEEVIGQESLNRESISTIQRNEPNLIETAFKKR